MNQSPTTTPKISRESNGRFTVPPGDVPQTHVVYVRVTKDEHAKIVARAAACGQSINQYAREQLLFDLDREDDTDGQA